MKHNISITVEQKLFRELENIRGREKRSTFIEHLIVLGLKTYRNKNEGDEVRKRNVPLILCPTSLSLSPEQRSRKQQ
jgi:metal-responsive CopG/Arc/MetJ family transcriptional regulator